MATLQEKTYCISYGASRPANLPFKNRLLLTELVRLQAYFGNRTLGENVTVQRLDSISRSVTLTEFCCLTYCYKSKDRESWTVY